MNTDSIIVGRQTDRGIQLLRIVACVSVFVCHFAQRMNFQNFSQMLFDFSQLTKYGVELFFVISGYLVCFSLAEGKSVIRFYKKRIIRILPLYYFCILYYYITETFIFHDIPKDPYNLGWLRYIFCLNGIAPTDWNYFWSNLGITWTIPVFLLFYLLAPIIVRIAKSVWISALILIGFIGLKFLINKTMPEYFTAFNYLPCFIFGVVVYKAKEENVRFLTAVGLLAFVIVFKWIDFGGALSGFLNDFVVSAIFAVMILFSEQFILHNRYCVKTFDVLDEYSYTLYLVHGIVFCGIIDKFEINIFLRIVIAVFLTAVLTFSIHKFIEKPIQNYMNKMLLVKRK